jgi:hypothetical protein
LESPLKTLSEYENSWYVGPNINNNLINEKRNNDSLVLINCCYFYPVNDLKKFHPINTKYGMKVFDHFLNFKAYQYEGFGIVERQNLDKMALKIKVLSN